MVASLAVRVVMMVMVVVMMVTTMSAMAGFSGLIVTRAAAPKTHDLGPQ
jgi:hypothetical protein